MQNIQKYLSNLAVLNVKLHNLHWNVVGVNFVAIHNFTESLYDEAFAHFDDVAEFLKMNDITPLSRIKDYLDHASIEEVEPKEFSTQEVLKILVDDLSLLKADAIAIRNALDEKSNFVGVALFEAHVAKYDKHLWFLKSMLK